MPFPPIGRSCKVHALLSLSCWWHAGKPIEGPPQSKATFLDQYGALTRNLFDQNIHIGARRAVIVECGAQAVATLHGRVRNSGDTGLLHPYHDFGVERLERRFGQPTRVIAKTDDVNFGRKTKAQIGESLDPFYQIPRVSDVLVD